nr:hypothetical protein [uncultured Rhodopila sp.]
MTLDPDSIIDELCIDGRAASLDPHQARRRAAELAEEEDDEEEDECASPPHQSLIERNL